MSSPRRALMICSSQTGASIRVLDAHLDVVTALAWLPDGSGFISGGLDRKIILWVRVPPSRSAPPPGTNCASSSQDIDGKQRDTWGRTPIRVTDLAITPDFTKLVAIGMYDSLSPPPASGPAASDAASGGTATPPTVPSAAAAGSRPSENRIIVYDLLTKQLETCVHPHSPWHASWR